jgi:RNA polymerase sigma-70 factor (ECF subfamily)
MPFFKSTLSQDDLIKGCIRNERRAQELLYKQYCQSLLTICISYIKNDADAKEVLQDGFLKIFQQIQRYDEKKSGLFTWMRTIMVRTAIDFLRRGMKEPDSTEWKEAHDPSIEAEVLSRMTADQILALLHQLPETTRMVFNLFITEGFSHKEIGAFLKISEGTSKWHLSEARKFLIGSLNIKIKERA